MKDNVPGMQTHCSPLQAASLKYHCSSNGNSSRTAIRKKKGEKKKQLHFAADSWDSAVDPSRTTSTGYEMSGNAIAVQMLIIMCAA